MGLKVKRPVTVKAIITEAFKARLVRELRAAADRIELEDQQMEFQGKRYLKDLQKRDLAKAMSTRRQLEEDKEKRLAMREEILTRIEQVQQLPLGTEFVQGTLETWVEVEIGDILEEKIANAEVVVRDDVIVEIREISPRGGLPTVFGQELGSPEPADSEEAVSGEPLPYGTA